MKTSILEREDLRQCRYWFAIACKASRQHNRMACDALNKYGDHGPVISGCVRKHFPDTVKNELRMLAHRVTEACDIAYGIRPRRVRMATIRKLAKAVAARDGSGFYGPQP